MPPFAFFSPLEAESARAAMLRFVQETGMQLAHPAVLHLLDGPGAAILNGSVPLHDHQSKTLDPIQNRELIALLGGAQKDH